MKMANILVHNQRVASAAGVLSLLFEPERKLQVHALKELNEVVDQFWPEIADYLSDIENFLEDSTFTDRHLASLLISKVYFHLEEYDESLKYALELGSNLDISERSPYVETIIAKCIDKYIQIGTSIYDYETKVAHYESESITMDPSEVKPVMDWRLETIVEKMLEMCARNGDEKQALGIAIDAKRLKKIKSIIVNSDKTVDLLEHIILHNQSLLLGKRFRDDVLELISEIFLSFPLEDLQNLYPSFCKVLFYRNDHEGVCIILAELLKNNSTEEDADKNVSIAFQIAFDLVDLEDQSFLNSMVKSRILRIPKPVENSSSSSENSIKNDDDKQSNENSEETSNTEENKTEKPSEDENAELNLINIDLLKRLHYILSGEASIELRLQFLHRTNHADLELLENYKNSVDARNSITHHGVVIAHSLLQAGTTSDTFLRNNIYWFGKAYNWAKFSAVASLGVVYKGHIKQSKVVLATYLPNNNQRRSPYSEGGALYALGLIHANQRDSNIREYLLNQLRTAQTDETLQHGACLGLGLLCMGQNDEDLYDTLKEVMFTDSAIAGEASAYAIGLIMLGSASKTAINELLAYAHDTQHEKIIRACGIALAMVMFRREEEAEVLIEKMVTDKDPLIRYGGMFTIGMAFCATAQDSAVRQLLHISVSDVSDDVRRAAIISLGFVLCNVPEQVPRMLHSLCESYNPHVRYAAALAIGISSAGSGSNESINLLLPMTSDRSNFVRQAALIGLGFVMQQVTDLMNDKVKKVRSILFRMLSNKNEDVMTRFGAILGAGLIDAGGRNLRASFFGKGGNLRQEAAVGFCLFTQLWYWYPLIHGISLSFLPTALIALNNKLKMPSNFQVLCNSSPSLFSYPPPTTKGRKLEKKAGVTAVLSKATKLQAKKPKKLVSKYLEDGEDIKLAPGKLPDDSISVMSELRSFRGVDVSSTSATVGGQSSRLSHTGSTADSTAEESTLAASDMGESVVANTEVGSSFPSDSRIKRNTEDPRNQISFLLKDIDEKKDTRDEKSFDDGASTFNIASNTQLKLSNPCRILPQQEKYIEFIEDARYIPVLKDRKSGFLMLRDTRPELPQEFVEPKGSETTFTEENEAELPEVFEWNGGLDVKV